MRMCSIRKKVGLIASVRSVALSKLMYCTNQMPQQINSEHLKSIYLVSGILRNASETHDAAQAP